MRRLLTRAGITDRASLVLFVKQFVKFGIVGVSNTLISLGVYYVLVYLSVYYILAHVASFVVSVCNAYFWNSRYVFSKKGGSEVKPFIRTFVVYGGTFLLSTGLLYVMVEMLFVSEWLAPLLNLCVTVPLNFLLNKYWAFR